jgi:hypothetical protein
MNEAALAPVDTNMGVTPLLSLRVSSPSSQSNLAPAAFGSGQHGPQAEEDVSIAGVLLLSAMSVLMAVAGMVFFALLVIGCWWLLSHVPVPASVHHLLARLHLARS